MSTILWTWELGGGWGHLVRFLPLARALVERGHRVAAAVRDLTHVRSVFGDMPVVFCRSPMPRRPPRAIFARPRTFAHILHNIGFAEREILGETVGAWMELYRAIGPDVIVFDHSPTALLAAQGYEARKIMMGSGFFIPPDESPLPDLRPTSYADPELLRRDEWRVTENLNEVLEKLRRPGMERLTRLYYRDVEQRMLMTFGELDHYGESRGNGVFSFQGSGRGGAEEYLGAWTEAGGEEPRWPEGRGMKAFAYLKPFPALGALLEALARRGVRALVVGDGIEGRVRERYEGSTVRFAAGRVDTRRAAEQCDFAILNGTHGTTAAMLLAGKPSLQIPIYVEQAMLAERLVRMGAGVMAGADRAGEIERAVGEMVEEGVETHARAARGFAERHRDFDGGRLAEEVVRRVCGRGDDEGAMGDGAWG